jgi:hypothetical protein
VCSGLAAPKAALALRFRTTWLLQTPARGVEWED